MPSNKALAKKAIAILGPPDKVTRKEMMEGSDADDDDEDIVAIEAVEDFFKAGAAGNYKKAWNLFKSLERLRFG